MTTSVYSNEPLQSLLAQYRHLQVLAPHPDDEVFGVAGLIQQAIAQGLNVHVYIATDGEKCFGDLPQAKTELLRQARRQESREAACILGCSQPWFWDLGDGQLRRHQSQLQRSIAKHQLAHSLWVAPWQRDGHPDHEAAGKAMAALHLPVLYYPIWALVETARLLQFKSSSLLHQLRLNDKQLAGKRQASGCFVSQFAEEQSEQRRIIGQQHLNHFVTQYEMYWHGN